jgi:long-chain acyl-CoA synthetase
MTLNLATLLRESANRFPDRAAVVLGDDVLRYRDLHDHAQGLAGRLRALGIARGEHVAVMMPNVPQFTIAYYGAHYAGTPVVPLNVLLVPDEIAYHLEDSDAVALIVFEELLPQARAGFDRVAGCRHLIVVRAGEYDLGDGAAPIEDVPDTGPDDTAVILYTSGTTGRPKGAELTHFNLLYNAEASLVQAPAGDVRVLLVLPLFHSFGQTVLQNATIRKSGTLVLMARFEPLGAAALIEKHKVNHFAGVPTMYFALLHHPEVQPAMLASLETCISGGAPMPVEVMQTFDRTFDVRISEGYGLSETSPLASCNPVELRKPGSIGVPIWGCEFRLVDAEGKVITETGVAGEIQIKGHNIMKGYYKRPDATAAAVTDGWFSTGDIATRDDDGYYFIVDRKKDLIIRGGFNVYPREVEEVLYAHPAVAEAAVIGIPHDSHGEEIKAVVAFKPGATAAPDELIAHCKRHLAAYKYPRVVEVIDALPKGPTGKILKRELR